MPAKETSAYSPQDEILRAALSRPKDGKKGCRICKFRTRDPARDLVMVWVGDEEILVCRSCYTDYTEATRMLVNGMRRLNGRPAIEFKNYLR